MKNTSSSHRNLIIAFNEEGEMKCCIEPLEGEVEQMIDYENFMNDIKQSKGHWELKTTGCIVPKLQKVSPNEIKEN